MPVHDVDSNTNSDNSSTNLNWAGIPDTLDNLTVAQVYEAIKNCFRHALNSDTYAKQTRQDMVMSGADTAAYAHGVPSDVDYREIPALMPLPGSTASGILTYNNTSASGTSATISV